MSLTLALQDDRYRAVPAFAWLDWGAASHVNYTQNLCRP